MKDYNEFIEQIIEILLQRPGAEWEIKAVSTEKNNGIVLHGISIREKNTVIAPTIYMHGYYEEYKRGSSPEKIAEQVQVLYENRKVKCNPDLSFFYSYEKVKSFLSVKLVNRDKNRNLLQHVPHRDFLDLALVFYCNLGDTPMGVASIMIRNEHIDIWGISVEELYEDALENVIRLAPVKRMSLYEVVRAVMDRIPIGIETEDCCGMEKAYILTNEDQQAGAAVLVYPGVLKKISKEIKDSFYILPSSIHEVILLPADGINSSDFLYDMVYEVNRTQVDPEEVLSDSVYFYDRERDELRLG